MAKIGLLSFFKQVKQEALKVTWCSRRETVINTSVVLVMVLISSVFFFVVDGIVFKLTQTVMGF
jgi:preprotein translocase subunit SecE